jgi:OmpA-OmpF porin, OOP family
MHKTLAFSLAIAMSGSTFAQSTGDVMASKPYSAYVQDAQGAITHSGEGLCWRTSYWTPADAVLGCDGDLVPPVASEIAPPIEPPKPPTPAPQPVLAPPPTPCDFTLTLQSDETFSFSSAQLGTAAKADLSRQLHDKMTKCVHVDSMVITGYTDRLGSDAYNQALSEKRASAVAEFLRKIGINDPIEQHGMGKAGEIKSCENVKIYKKLVNCLAPNRRVDIAVHGNGG